MSFVDGALRGTYPVTSGETYVWAGIPLPPNAADVTIEFDARMPSDAKNGLKFVKFFGHHNAGSSGYANTTFGLDYTGVDLGSLYAVSFGDGTTRQNDTQNVIFLDGSNPSWIGRSFGTATVSTPQARRFASSDWKADWHHFVMRVRFNSGTSAADEVADGLVYLQIDGKVYVDAVGIFNRNPADARAFDSVGLFGWSQGNGPAFTIDYDNVVVTAR